MGKEQDKSGQLGINSVIKRALAFKESRRIQKLHRIKGATGRHWNVGADTDSDSLSDIDDCEISGYLHNRDEMLYKKMIWEIINKDVRDASKGKLGQKQTRKAKNATSTKDAVRSTGDVDKKKKFSSKINYNILKEQIEKDQEPSEEKINEHVLSDQGNDGDTEQADEIYHGEENSHGTGDYDEFEDEHGEDFDVNSANYNDYASDNEDGYNYDEDYDNEIF